MPESDSRRERPTTGRQRAAALRAEQERRRRQRRLLLGSAAAVLTVVLVVVVIVLLASRKPAKIAATKPTTVGTSAVATTGTGTATATTAADQASAVLTGPTGPEGIALEQGAVLAAAPAASTGATIDGVQCNTSEQVVYHIHTHLTVYVDGKLRPIPGGIGMDTPAQQATPNGTFFQATHCYYWLHVHAQDGVIHIEAPSQKLYTLGQFFAVWGQPLSARAIGPAGGAVTAYVNGTKYTGAIGSIQLTSREDIQLDVETPAVPPRRVDWSASQL